MIIYLDDHRARMGSWLSKFQHLASGVPLLFIGLKSLIINQAERPIAAVEVVIALAVCVSFLRELRAELRREIAHTRFSWIDLAAGILLIFEAFHSAHGKPGYLRPQFLAGAATVGLGLFHARLQARAHRRHYLKLDDVGFKFQATRFRWFSLKWTEVASIELSETCVIFLRNDGKISSIRLFLFRNADEIRSAILDHPAAGALITAHSSQRSQCSANGRSV